MKILIPLIAMILNGCASAGYVSTVTNQYKTQTSNIQIHNGKVIPRNCLSKEVGNIEKCGQRKDYITTINDALFLWGEPDLKHEADNLIHLTYNRSFSWRGLFANILIIPIPLLVPTGYNNTVLIFDNNEMIGAEVEYGKYHHILCGYHSTGPNGFGCYNTFKK